MASFSLCEYFAKGNELTLLKIVADGNRTICLGTKESEQVIWNRLVN